MSKSQFRCAIHNYVGKYPSFILLQLIMNNASRLRGPSVPIKGNFNFLPPSSILTYKAISASINKKLTSYVPIAYKNFPNVYLSLNNFDLNHEIYSLRN